MPKPPQRSILEIDWPFFGELCRGLALKVWHDYQPDLVVGIARAGVLPGAVVASILRVEFASMSLRRMQRGEEPALIHRPTQSPQGHHVLLVDSTCESGATLRLALNVLKQEGAREVKTAVAIRTGAYAPDFAALQNPSFVILPWDHDVIEDGQLVVRPDYAEALKLAGLGAATGGTDAPTRKRTGRAKA
jgi:hypoxanthine phosphoribosyltransferase